MYSLYFDGASRGNPGQAAYGGVIYFKNTEIYNYSRKITHITTNNIAEYCGLYHGLLLAHKKNIRHIKVYGDSMLVINQVTHTWKVRNDNIKILHKNIVKLLDDFDLITFEHVKRNYNKRADQLANEAFDK